MNDDMETIPPRLNKVEREIHTHEHRITQLEQLPPRVAYIESHVNAMSVKIAHMEKLTTSVAEKQDRILENQTTQAAQNNTTTRNITLLCTVLGAVAVIIAWIGG